MWMKCPLQIDLMNNNKKYMKRIRFKKKKNKFQQKKTSCKKNNKIAFKKNKIIKEELEKV